MIPHSFFFISICSFSDKCSRAPAAFTSWLNWNKFSPMSRMKAFASKQNPATKISTTTKISPATNWVTVWMNAHRMYPDGVFQSNGYLIRWKIHFWFDYYKMRTRIVLPGRVNLLEGLIRIVWWKVFNEGYSDRELCQNWHDDVSNPIM